MTKNRCRPTVVRDAHPVADPHAEHAVADRLWGRPLRGRPGARDVVAVLSATFSRQGGPMPALRNVLLEAFTNLDDFLAEPDRYWADLVWVAGLLLVPLGRWRWSSP